MREPDEQLSVKIPPYVLRQLKLRVAENGSTHRIEVLRALKAGGYDVDEVDIVDRRVEANQLKSALYKSVRGDYEDQAGLAQQARTMSFKEISDDLFRLLGILVRDIDDMENAMIIVDRVRKTSGGHFTLMNFTTNSRAYFGTPEVRGGHGMDGVDWMPCGKTPVEAICRAAWAQVHGADLWPV